MGETPETGRARAFVPEDASRVPAGPPNFIGRIDILNDLDSLLSQQPGEQPRTVVIEGMPGIGKTGLAVHWASVKRSEFADGAVFIDLRGFSTDSAINPAEAWRQLLISMGVPAHQIPDDYAARATMYHERLKNRDSLLILDNASGQDQVELLLPATSSPLAIITSRSHFREAEGRGFMRIYQLDVLSPEEATALLTSIIGEQRIQREPGAVKELIDICGYLPLALRIVAANLSRNPDAEISATVQELTAEPLTALSLDEAPNVAVRNTLDLSYRNLDDELKQTFRLLGLFPGRDVTAEAVAALTGTFLETAQASLLKLRLASMLEVSAPGRYRLHDLLHEFARECVSLEEDDADRFDAIERLLNWYLATARNLGGFLGRRRRGMTGGLPLGNTVADPDDWEMRLEWFEAERQNLVIAVRQADNVGSYSVAWELADALYDFLELRGFGSDNISVHRIGLSAAEHVGNLTAESYMRHHLAVIYRGLGRYDSAIKEAERSLRLNQSLHDRYAEAVVRNNIARIKYVTGDYLESLENAEIALSMRQEIGDRLGEAQTLNSLGRTLRALGRYPEALRVTLEALDIRQGINDHLGEAETLETLARLYRLLGWYEEALNCGNQALEMRRKLGDRLGEGESLQNLARVYRRLGSYSQARDYALRALKIMQDIGHRRGVAEAHATFGDIEVDSARTLDKALSSYRLSLEIRQEIGDQRGISESYLSIARALRKDGNYEESELNSLRSLNISQSIGDRFGEARTYDALARIYQLTGYSSRALDAAEKALEIRKEIGDLRGEGDTLDSIARIHRRTGEYHIALSYAEQAYDILRRIGDRRGQGKALDSIARIQLDEGELAKAIKTIRQAAETWSDIGDQRSLSKTLDLLEEIASFGATYAGKADTSTAPSKKWRSFLDGVISIFDITGTYGVSRQRNRADKRRAADINLAGAALRELMPDDSATYGQEELNGR